MGNIDRRQILAGLAATPSLALVPGMALAEDYEGGRALKPRKTLPEDLQKGDYFEVVGDVIAQGYSNRYDLTTRYGDSQVVTQDMLAKRAHEALALAYLETIQNTEAFAQGMMRALKSPYKAVRALVTDPVNTVKGVPEGIWKFGRRIGEIFTGSRGDDEDHIAEELLGFSQIKRKIAFKLGVDVYTQNEPLQRAMNDVAYAGFAGGFIINTAMGGIPIGSIANRALSAVEFTRTAAQYLRDNAPEDLRIQNRRSLRDMGISKQDIERFIDNDVFSPRHETVITLALAAMDGIGNRTALVRRTHGVNSTIGALLTQRSIEMLRSYHATVARGVQLVDVGPHAGLLDENNTLVLAMPADRIHWTQWFASAVTELAAYPNAGVSSRRIVIVGEVSRKAEKGAERNGIELMTNTRDTLLPHPDVEWPDPDIEIDTADLPVPGSPISLKGSVTPVSDQGLAPATQDASQQGSMQQGNGQEQQAPAPQPEPQKEEAPKRILF